VACELSATPQLSNRNMGFDVAGALRVQSRCETGVPACSARVAEATLTTRIVRGLAPVGIRQIVADVAVKFRGRRGVDTKRKSRAPGRRSGMDRRLPFSG